MKRDLNKIIIFDDDTPIKKDILIKDCEINKKKKNITKKLLLIVSIFFISIFCLSSYKLLTWIIDNKKTNNNINELDNIADLEELTDDEQVELLNAPDDQDDDYWYYIKFPLVQVNFDNLKKKNKDTVGWIFVNNTNINYPVVQTSDNDYYLTHSFDKSSNEAGWVFMDYRNNQDFDNKNTIIYAHSRLNKTMFGTLSKVLKNSWYNNKDNHIIKISTPDENSLWQIFSVYKIKAENYYITTDFNSDSTYLEFLETIKGRSKYNFNVTLNSNDSILTLSTCYSDTERTVVHAKKIKKSKRDS